jgi:DNA-binding NarL/FixJ family response regulator
MAHATRPTRIVLADLPVMLRQIVRDAVTAEPDMEVIGEFDASGLFFEALNRADVVIAGTREPERSAFPHSVLSASPAAKVLMIAVADPAATMYELRRHQTALGDLSPSGLVEAIRNAVATNHDIP